MYFKLSFNKHKFMLKFQGVISVIVGDSSTGKTTLVNDIRMCKKKYDTDATKVIVDINDDTVLNCPSGSLIFIDLDSYDDVDILDSIVRSNRNDICIVLLGRSNLRRFPIDCRNMFKLVTVKGITKNIPYIELPLMCHKEFDKVVTEDKYSGKHFIECIFNNVVSSEGIAKLIKEDYSDYLKVFDSCGCGGYIEAFLDMYSNTPYFTWTSFEGFILENVYSESTLIHAMNVESALTNKLNLINPNYSKSSYCYSSNCITCSKSCKVNPKLLFQKSIYSDFLDLQKETDVTVLDSVFNDLSVDESIRDRIKSLLPTTEMPYDLLKDTVVNAIKYVK